MAFFSKWILFDFGGCLDSDGTHSRQLFFRAFQNQGLVMAQDWDSFQEAYSTTDRAVVDQGLIVDSGLSEMNRTMCQMIGACLDGMTSSAVTRAADEITDVQDRFLRRNKSLLDQLGATYSLGVISNFSGNLAVILRDYGLTELFSFVLDSYHVGFAKPDRRIFARAVQLTGAEPTQICFIGDNPRRDIMPAREMGLKTILIHEGEPPQDNGGAHRMIRTLPEILEYDQ